MKIYDRDGKLCWLDILAFIGTLAFAWAIVQKFGVGR